MSHPASVFVGTKGERVALCDVAVSAALHDALTEVTVSQTYRNCEDVNIEAVYTFPLPLDAVLLDLSVTIGGRTLKGTVVEKKAAEARYEDAIADGNSAVMLELLEPGLYTMNVGNLLPAETVVIAVTYAVMYRWVGDDLRILIPTTIAPRYGQWPHAPHQTPVTSLTVENQFSIQVEVFGSLRQARFECPSHEVTLASSSDRTTITLSRAKAAMDRDFVLVVKAPRAAQSFALCGVDEAGDEGGEAGQGAAVVAAFQPTFPGLRKPRALNLAVIVDCSGSMQGDSIAQARQALAGILDGLQPGDRITIVAFGSTTKVLFNHLMPCTEATLRQARQFAAELKADMGGTEVADALQAAYAATSGSERADILLVTDGEVSQWKRVVADAKTSGRRIFTVGVGHAVSEAFVRELAVATFGECEMVSPREGMAERVVRHFERLRAPRARRVVVHWPEGARDLAPATFGAVFEGDTVVASARFDRPSVTGLAVLEIETESGQVFRQELAIGHVPAPQSGSRVSTVARLAAAGRIQDLDREAALATALRYQLASPLTNWLVVAERPAGEQAFDPALRMVPQTLAAGWGGVGSAIVHSGSAMDLRASMSLSKLTGDVEVSGCAMPDQDALRLEEFVSEFDDLSEDLDRLWRDVATATDHASGAIDALRNDIEQLLTRVVATLHAMERRAEDMRPALEELGRKTGDSEHRDAIAEALGRLAALRKRLRNMQVVLEGLAHRQERLREVESILRELS